MFFLVIIIKRCNYLDISKPGRNDEVVYTYIPKYDSISLKTAFIIGTVHKTTMKTLQIANRAHFSLKHFESHNPAWWLSGPCTIIVCELKYNVEKLFCKVYMFCFCYTVVNRCLMINVNLVTNWHLCRIHCDNSKNKRTTCSASLSEDSQCFVYSSTYSTYVFDGKICCVLVIFELYFPN